MATAFSPARDADPRAPQRRSLLTLLFWANTAVVLAAVVLLASTPFTISWPADVRGAVLLGVAVAAMLLVDLLVLRRVLTPLGELWRVMRAIDPLRPGHRIAIDARSREVADLTQAFNDMLDRLEAERRDSARRQQAAQDAERRWLALELHDQIGQELTALLLTIDVAGRIDDDRRDEVLGTATQTAQDCLERVRGIATRLRPDGLDELGLTSALLHLCDQISAGDHLRIVRRFDPDLPELDRDTRLAIYRIAQESLTNAVRHAAAGEVRLTLETTPDGVRLTVADDGVGLDAAARQGTGIRGMRERALLLGADLAVEARAPAGTVVRLDVPVEEAVLAA